MKEERETDQTCAGMEAKGGRKNMRKKRKRGRTALCFALYEYIECTPNDLVVGGCGGDVRIVWVEERDRR